MTARTFHRGEALCRAVQRTFTRIDPLPPLDARAHTPGLRVEQFLADAHEIPDDLSGWRALATFASPDVRLPIEPGERTALRFAGFVEAPADDVYRFLLVSDDRSKLWIDHQLVVDNAHGSLDTRGAIALRQGLHAIEIVWLHEASRRELSLHWARPGAAMSAVPAAAFRH